ncbi:MAG TPA: hypothetical protein VIY51_14390 [Xanthobacteraceae bacterium]
MHPRTVATLNELEKAAWFSRVGIKEGSDAAVVSTWLEAIEYCSSFEWEDLQGEMLNQYRECIAERSEEHLRLWNDTVREVKKITGPLLDRKIATLVRENNLPRIFKVQVNYDITGFCMEAEYADVCLPGFFTNIGYWYVKGHFPCGWWGPFPEGKLVIY